MAASFRKSFYDKNCLDLAQIVAIFYVTFPFIYLQDQE